MLDWLSLRMAILLADVKLAPTHLLAWSRVWMVVNVIMLPKGVTDELTALMQLMKQTVSSMFTALFFSLFFRTLTD